MKNLITSLAFMAICSCVAAQVKNADSAKKPIPSATNRTSVLVQEKIWPTSTTKNGKVVAPHVIAQTRSRL